MASVGVFDLLLGLPSDLSSSILLAWLNVKHVVAVDNAYCDSKKRPHLLTLFSGEQFIMPEKVFKKRKEHKEDDEEDDDDEDDDEEEEEDDDDEDKDTEESLYLPWICRRGVRVACLEVAGKVEPFIVEYAKKLTGGVKNLRFRKIDFVKSADNSQRCVQVLNACSGIVVLKMDTCVMTRAVIEAILQSTSLRDLRISDCATHSTHEGFRLDTLPVTEKLHLRTLQLYGRTLFSPVFWNAFVPESLEVLAITLNDNFTSADIAEKLALCTNLNALQLSSSLRDANDVGEQFTELIRLCPHIEHFDLKAYGTKDNLASVITGTLTNLKTICLNNCDDDFLNDVFEQLAEKGSEKLEAVYIDGGYCFEECVESFTALMSSCTGIRTLYIDEWGWPMDVLEEFDMSLFDDLTTLRVDIRFSGFYVDCPNLVHFGLYFSDHNWEPGQYEGFVRSYTLPALKVWEIGPHKGSNLSSVRKSRPDVEIRTNKKYLSYDFCDVALGISK